MRIKAGSDRHSACRQSVEAVNCESNPPQIALDQRGPPRDFLIHG
jgi:hypothetical protein